MLPSLEDVTEDTRWLERVLDKGEAMEATDGGGDNGDGDVGGDGTGGRGRSNKLILQDDWAVR